MGKLRVAVLFGGRSGEHEVSLASARAVMAGLNRAKYAVIPIGISRAGEWRRGRTGQAPAAVLATGRVFAMPADPRAARRCGIDFVLPILHGTFGEDGTLQGLLDLAGVPYAGSGVMGSAASMDKDVMKRLFQQAGLPVAAFERVSRQEWEQHPRAVAARLRRALPFPMFVKPANLGSSVGISKVHNAAELEPALALAARYDSKLIVERGVDARELECAVLGNDAPEASVVGEVIAGREFYDYEAKYMESGSRTVIPAPIPERTAREVRRMAVAAFQATECAGLARVDFFLERGTGRVLLNEVNTMPGFTAISMYPKLWEASGVGFGALLDRLIALGMERAREAGRNQVTSNHGEISV